MRLAVLTLAAYLFLLALATGTRAAVPSWPWLALARCETGATWTWYNRTYEGAYGFTHAAWRQFRYPGYPSSANRATPAQQTAGAARIQRAVGWGAWPACSIRLGVRGARPP